MSIKSKLKKCPLEMVFTMLFITLMKYILKDILKYVQYRLKNTIMNKASTDMVLKYHRATL